MAANDKSPTGFAMESPRRESKVNLKKIGHWMKMSYLPERERRRESSGKWKKSGERRREKRKGQEDEEEKEKKNEKEIASAQG